MNKAGTKLPPRDHRLESHRPTSRLTPRWLVQNPGLHRAKLPASWVLIHLSRGGKPEHHLPSVPQGGHPVSLPAAPADWAAVTFFQGARSRSMATFLMGSGFILQSPFPHFKLVPERFALPSPGFSVSQQGSNLRCCLSNSDLCRLQPQV